MWILQGRLIETQGWVREQGLSVDDATSYLLEFQHMTLARMLIAQYKSGRGTDSIQEALKLLDRLLLAAEAGGRVGNVLEILVLQALAHQAQGNITFALAPLSRALDLAEPEGYIRIFIDEGEPMLDLLTRIDVKDGTPRFAQHLSYAHQKHLQQAGSLIMAVWLIVKGLR